MDKKVISISHNMKGPLDDDYTLYDDGTVLHKYDRHGYPGGSNIEDHLTADDLTDPIKERLYAAASEEYKDLVHQTLKLK